MDSILVGICAVSPFAPYGQRYIIQFLYRPFLQGYSGRLDIFLQFRKPPEPDQHRRYCFSGAEGSFSLSDAELGEAGRQCIFMNKPWLTVKGA